MFAKGETVGLAEWIIDDSCLFISLSSYLFSPKFVRKEFPLSKKKKSYSIFMGVYGFFKTIASCLVQNCFTHKEIEKATLAFYLSQRG